MHKHDLPALKARFTISNLWERLGLPGKPSHTCRSPFRPDKSPSFSIYDEGHRWKDFATGDGGDVIDFIARAYDVDLAEATRRFLELADVNAIPVPPRMTERAPRASDDGQRLRENLRKARLHAGSREEVGAVARIRGIAPDSVHIAQKLATVTFGSVCGFPCWILTDAAGMVAEARRMDGKLFPPACSLAERKAHTLGGSTKSWPAGVAVLKDKPDFRAVMLVEGGPDYLSAFHFALEAGAGDVLPIAMMGRGTGSVIHPDALALLAGRRVRIYPHEDPDGGGTNSAQKWAKQLHAIGCEVDFFSVAKLSRRDGIPVTDLNDAVLIHSDHKHELFKLLP